MAPFPFLSYTTHIGSPSSFLDIIYNLVPGGGPTWYFFPPALTSKLPLMARSDVVSNQYLFSAFILVNCIIVCLQLVDPLDLFCRNFVIWIFQPFVTGISFFPATYITCLLALFLNSLWNFVTWLPSVSIHSTFQHNGYISILLFFHCVSGHYLLACRLHLPYYPQIPSPLSPITPVTKFHNSKPLHQIMQVPSYSPDVHTLLSITALLPS